MFYNLSPEDFDCPTCGGVRVFRRNVLGLLVLACGDCEADKFSRHMLGIAEPTEQEIIEPARESDKESFEDVD